VRGSYLNRIAGLMLWSAGAMTLVACSNVDQWEGRVYSGKGGATDFIPVGIFTTLEECRDAGTTLIKRMQQGRNGQASQDYSQGRTVCTKL
jgi:hypothetical protein